MKRALACWLLPCLYTLLACGSEPKTPAEAADTESPSDGSATPPPDTDNSPGAQAGLPSGYSPVAYRSATPVREFAAAQSVLEPDLDYVAWLETDAGAFLIDLYETEAPTTVNSFVFLALHHFYEQIAFHRVIEDFMAQTGDPNSVAGAQSSWGQGGPGYQFGLEVHPELNFDGPGVLGMARTNDPNSNGSQFFITLEAAAHLDQSYTVWGKVTSGLEVLQAIDRGEPPADPARITRVTIGTKPK